MKVLAIIPARGGSKGIPRKNIRLLAGKPLIAWTIEAALVSTTVERVIVSTEDPEIAGVANQCGAEVVWRPVEFATDTAASETVLLHALDELRLKEKYDPGLVVFLQCIAPLTLPQDIDNTVRMLIEENADSALSVTPFHRFLWQGGVEGDAVGINHDKKVRLLRQQREPQFVETGAVYVMRTEGFKKAKHRFFGKIAMYVMPAERSWEIDAPVDFLIAEVLLREQQRKKMEDLLPGPMEALVLDFDGVFTDNRVWVSQDGREAVLCDRSDGWGLAQLKKKGLPILVLSSEENLIIAARCRKLNLPYRQALEDKAKAMQQYLEEHRINHDKVIFLGNDVNDLECMNLAGCAVAVANAHPAVLAAADFILEKPGGCGAVRGLCDLILRRWESKEKHKSRR